MVRYCLERATRRVPGKPALIVARDPRDETSDEVWTYEALEDAVLRVAGGLAGIGLQPGDRILIRIANTSDYALLFFGAVAAGYVPIPASDQLSDREVAFLCADSGARAIAVPDRKTLPTGLDVKCVIDADGIAALKQAARADYADTSADDPAFLIYTSGTSGLPKGVLHAHRAAWGRRPMYKGWYGIGEDDVMVHAGAFNWTYTIGVGMSDPWANAATAVVYTGDRGPTVWPALIERCRGSIFAAVPSVYRQILKYNTIEPGAIPTLRHGLTAGEALPRAVRDDWFAATGRKLFEALGMSEISTYISTAPTMEIKQGSPGVIQEGRSVAILPVDGGTDPLPLGETGLLAVHRSDPGLMLGYWERPDDMASSFRGDWFCGGDLARFDPDGYLWFEGRNDDVMNAMGYRVAPAEVESVLGSHPAVDECAAAEVEVQPNVSVIMGFVVTHQQHQVSAETLLEHTASGLAAYKCPREIVFVDALPRTANGKVKRKELALHRQAAAG